VTWLDAPAAVVPVVPGVPPATPTPPQPPAQLMLRIEGPAVADVEAAATYQITVSNLGTQEIPSVEVTSELPRELQFQRSSPQAGEFGGTLRWELGSLLPGDSRAISLDCRVAGTGLVRVCAKGAGGAATAEDCATTEVRSGGLVVEIRGPASAMVGDTVACDISLFNPSSQVIENIILEDVFDAGLEHVVGPGPLVTDLGSLNPNETRLYPIRFIARQAGRLCHQVTAKSGDGREARDEFCVEVLESPQGGPLGASPPVVRVEVRGPSSIAAGTIEQFDIVVNNTGSAALTSLEVRASFDPALQATETAPTATMAADGLAWVIPWIDAGATQVIQLRCRGLNSAERACLRTTVTAREGATDSREFCVAVSGGTQYIPPANPFVVPGEPPVIDPGSSQNGRDLQVRVLRSPAPPGAAAATLLYGVEISNQGRDPHSDVVLRIKVPDGTQYFTSLTPPLVDPVFVSADKTQVDFRPIQVLRPGEMVRFTITVSSGGISAGTFRAEVSSTEDREPVVATD
ncbi:MAG TPA: hypothetical protein VIY86_12200, partial [Pirellulaceae bacterium]